MDRNVVDRPEYRLFPTAWKTPKVTELSAFLLNFHVNWTLFSRNCAPAMRVGWRLQDITRYSTFHQFSALSVRQNSSLGRKRAKCRVFGGICQSYRSKRGQRPGHTHPSFCEEFGLWGKDRRKTPKTHWREFQDSSKQTQSEKRFPLKLFVWALCAVYR
jgi:hypothetical protein